MEPQLQPVAEYYAEKLRQHGATPRGVDWKNAEGQALRFSMLLRLVPSNARDFTLDDYGCGYGALLDHAVGAGHAVDYLGLDVSSGMIAEARNRHPADAARFVEGTRSPRRADYAVASGIFNVRLQAPIADWERHVLATLDNLHAASTKGFSFNCLSRISDPAFRKDYLYYADPGFYFDLCMTRYARNVALLHDYGLYEFTILVKMQPTP
jgi:SAM-dependent methyltransferase